MQAKRISGLVSLSLQLYLLSQDEKFRADLARLISALKLKARKAVEHMDADKQETVCAIYHRVSEISNALESKMKEAAGDLYGKLHIATTTDVKQLSAEIADLARDLATLEERLAKLEQEKR